ncbi:glycosyltransferase [Ilumatobacter sp.]|uniref:glycosyltransferase n=1 Tax=Ilumatobacter sp. TaxID=1967498 RepID=UPI003C540CE1
MISKCDAAVPELSDSCLVVDGGDPELTDAHIHRIAGHWRSQREIIVTGVDRPGPHGVALSIAAACSGRIVIEPDRRHGLRCATIVPATEVAPPEPLPHPPRPANVPARMMVGPPPSVANDHRERTRHARGGPIPSTPVSIVVTVDDDRRTSLGRTLACLTQQTYPRELIEVIVADSGSSEQSDEVLDGFRAHVGGVRHVRQTDGSRIRTRNLGIRAASHENVLLLACDMAPTPRLVELHVRHLEAFPNAIYCGHQRRVDANDVTGEAIHRSIEPMLALPDAGSADEQVDAGESASTNDWRLAIAASTADLRFEPHPFRVVQGDNLSFTRSLFDITGDFDERFTDCTSADVEWGFRVWNRGFYIVPLIDACGLRQVSPTDCIGTDRERTPDLSPPTLVDLCPVQFRPANPDGGFTVPLVSIYIPAYNAEDTIVDSVQSALDQTVQDLEVCVVNDGSTDATLERLTEHFRDDPRVRIDDQENGGIGSASNRAVRMCRGAFIGQLDADDELTPDAVELMLAPMLRETRIGVSYGSFVKIDPAGKLIGDAYVVPRYSHFTMLHLMIVHPFRLFRARDWHRTVGFAEDLRNAVDYDMYLKMSEVTEMVHVDERVYRYRIHDASTSRKHQASQHRNHAIVVGRALERRGLAAAWAMEPLDPDDPRKYRFVETEVARQRSALPTARIRVVGAPDDIERKVLSGFPGWRREADVDTSTGVLTSPRLSPGRTPRFVGVLRSALGDTNAEVDIST